MKAKYRTIFDTNQLNFNPEDPIKSDGGARVQIPWVNPGSVTKFIVKYFSSIFNKPLGIE